jgi:hypothetical protein
MKFDQLVEQALRTTIKESAVYPEYPGMTPVEVARKRDAIDRKKFKLQIQAEQPEKLKFFLKPGETVEPLTPEEEEFMTATAPIANINTKVSRTPDQERLRSREINA